MALLDDPPWPSAADQSWLDEWGFTVTQRTDDQVVLDSPFLRVTLYVERWFLSASLSMLGMQHSHGISDVLNTVRPEMGFKPRPLAPFDDADVRLEFDRLMSLVRVHCQPLLRGDTDLWRTVDVWASARVASILDESRARGADGRRRMYRERWEQALGQVPEARLTVRNVGTRGLMRFRVMTRGVAVEGDFVEPGASVETRAPTGHVVIEADWPGQAKDLKEVRELALTVGEEKEVVFGGK